MPGARNDIPVEYLRECFEANEAGELYWKERPRSHFSGSNMLRWSFAGSRAGRIGNKGYWIVTLYHAGRQRKLLVHRIVWALAYGAWPKNDIDHINRIRVDNRLQNMRDVTPAQNMQNRECSQLRTCPTGIYPTASGKFRVQIKRKGKFLYLGTFGSEGDASAALAMAPAA